MKKILSISIILLPFITIIFWSCEPLVSYPVIPEIKFKSLLIEDSLDLENPLNSKKKFVLTFSLIDGDGDIGIRYDNSTFYPGFEEFDNKDLFITIYEKVEGEFVEVPLAFPYNYSLPYLEPEGQDKSLKADILISFQIDYAFYTYDTLKYSFYVYDRQKHLSNTAETPEIPADTLGLISVE